MNKYSDKNLTNTEAQTNQKTLNTEEINFEFEDNLDEKVSEEIISKLKNIVDTASKLELTIKESLYLKEGLVIKINALGLLDKSLRNKKDGNTYFGILSPNEESNDKKIDFSTGNSTNLVESGRQFCIKFDLNENCYMIKDSLIKLMEEIKDEKGRIIRTKNKRETINYEEFSERMHSLSLRQRTLFMNKKKNFCEKIKEEAIQNSKLRQAQK